jgi:hypothetical protein
MPFGLARQLRELSSSKLPEGIVVLKQDFEDCDVASDASGPVRLRRLLTLVISVAALVCFAVGALIAERIATIGISVLGK